MTITFAIAIALIIIGLVILSRGIRMVPQQHAWVVERFGRFHRLLEPGLNIIIPVFDRVAYKFDLRESPINVSEQVCITKDNAQITIDGVLYLQITDPKKAAYGTSDPFAAVEQLSQTVMRSDVGKKQLDEVLSSRAELNRSIVSELDQAATNWGVKVLRYEIRRIQPPAEVTHAMELQLTSEREKRARIAKSEGERQQAVNVAEGKKKSRVLEAEGEADALLKVAEAQARAIAKIGEALSEKGGDKAMQMRLASDLISQFGNLASESNTMIVPADMGDMSRFLGTAMSIVGGEKGRAVPHAPDASSE
ncbi:MAG TPA: SPFH domain-containing protein [Gammaproteobacteria bacterium]|nr:SPFH domain-containing protein [Gammaproteobacteria bacterium]